MRVVHMEAPNGTGADVVVYGDMVVAGCGNVLAWRFGDELDRESVGKKVEGQAITPRVARLVEAAGYVATVRPPLADSQY